jgi:exonuclease SbcC
VTRLARARAAAGVRGALDGAGAAATELDTVAKELDAALDIAPAGLVPKRLARAVAGAGTGAGAFGSGAGAVDAPDEGTGAATGALAALREHLEKQRRAAVQAAGAIERARRLEEGLVEQRKAARDLARHVDDLRTEVAGHTSWLDARPAERAELLTLRDAARSAVARLDGCRAAVERARDVLDAVRALATTGRELDAARGRCSVAAAAASAAVGEEAAARTRRLAGLAGELARALSDGDPCPVCGSDAHPLPAPLTPDHVSAEQVDAAAARREAAEKSVAALAATVAGLAERAEQLAARAGGLVESAASEALTCADAELAACAATAADEPRLTADLTGFDALTAERATTRAAVATDLATQEAALAVARAALDEAEAEVLTAREGFETVAARHSALVHRSEAADGLCQVLADRSEAADRLVVRRAELDLALTAAGFASDDDARAALLGPADVDRLDRQVSAHVADTARVAAALAEPELVDLPDDLRIDVRAAEQAERDARTAADGALTAAHAAEDRAAAARAAAGVVVDRAEAVAAALVSAAPIGRIAALASGGGDNAAGLSLATFVLLRRFEDVVAAANERLTTMSDGRYELVRSDEKEDVRARNTGLAMRVVDHLTDTPRDPRTLSGGETFYVSLALALGMADVVRAESGGIELGTLFVDEGFGSLDPHVLDQVLTELGRLRAGGRVVGVVSHVEAMKQAIADRIEVRPLPGGASTLTVRAG